MAAQALAIVSGKFMLEGLVRIMTGGAHQPRISISPTPALFEP